MEKRETICSICGKSKTPNESGRVSQFISTCVCDLKPSEDVQKVSINICKDCGKKIDTGRVGSMTQYVLRHEMCQCKIPNPRNLPESIESDKNITPAFAGYTEEEEIEAEDLDIHEDDFPFERYQPLKRLGEGSSGQVYLAKDKLLKKKVALKILHVLTNEQLVSFQEEAKTTSKLDHPSIVGILDFGATESGTPFMALEYFKGITLEQYLKENGPLSWETCQSIFIQICEALNYAHSQGIYHRDLKPSNILFNLESENMVQVRLIDFGLAKVSELTGKTTEFQGKTLVGTPYYMSPDSAKGYDYTSRSEIYSVGCIMFEALTQTPPFKGTTALETLALHAKEEAPKIESLAPEIPARAQALIDKCLAKLPEDRFASAYELTQAIADANFSDQSSDNLDIIEESKPEVYTTNGTRVRTIWIVVAFCLFIVPVLLVANTAFKSDSSIEKAGQSQKSAKIETSFESNVEKSLGVLPKIGDKVFKEKSIVINKNIEDEELKSTKFPNDVSAFSITSNKFTGTGLKYAPKHTLELVEINCPLFNEAGAEYLGKMVSVTEIDLKGVNKLSPLGYRKLSRAPNLIRIHLKKTTIPKGAFKFMANSPKLRTLVLSDCKLENDYDLIYLNQIPNLNYLRLTYTDLSSTGYSAFAKLTRLLSTTINGTMLNEEDTKEISKGYLPSIRFSNCTIPDVAFLKLAKSQHIKRVYLRNPKGTSNFCFRTFRELRPDIMLDTNAESATVNQLKKDFKNHDRLQKNPTKWSTE